MPNYNNVIIILQLIQRKHKLLKYNSILSFLGASAVLYSAIIFLSLISVCMKNKHSILLLLQKSHIYAQKKSHAKLNFQLGNPRLTTKIFPILRIPRASMRILEAFN